MSYHYLASPYTHPDPAVVLEHYEAALKATNWLLSKRIWTYSPIVHCHELANRFDLPIHAEYWEEYNRAMLLSAIGLFVLDIPGRKTSRGVIFEWHLARDESIPITLLRPSGRTYTQTPWIGES
jgi:Domain of unknown function (DUF1937)